MRPLYAGAWAMAAIRGERMIDHCLRCDRLDDLVDCINSQTGELLARICENCVKEWNESGLDDL